MEGLYALGALGFFILFTGILFMVLNIMLFFKIWGMTNNINHIKDMLQEWLDLEHPLVDKDSGKIDAADKLNS